MFLHSTSPVLLGFGPGTYVPLFTVICVNSLSSRDCSVKFWSVWRFRLACLHVTHSLFISLTDSLILRLEFCHCLHSLPCPLRMFSSCGFASQAGSDPTGRYTWAASILSLQRLSHPVAPSPDIRFLGACWRLPYIDSLPARASSCAHSCF